MSVCSRVIACRLFSKRGIKTTVAVYSAHFFSTIINCFVCVCVCVRACERCIICYGRLLPLITLQIINESRNFSTFMNTSLQKCIFWCDCVYACSQQNLGHFQCYMVFHSETVILISELNIKWIEIRHFSLHHLFY